MCSKCFEQLFISVNFWYRKSRWTLRPVFQRGVISMEFGLSYNRCVDFLNFAGIVVMLLDKQFKRKTYIIDSSYYICNKEYITYQDILIILDANCVLVITWTFKRKIINVYIQTLIIIYKKSYISKKRRLVRAIRETSKFPNWSLLTNSSHRYMAEILWIQGKTPSNKSYTYIYIC